VPIRTVLRWAVWLSLLIIVLVLVVVS